MFRLTVLKLMMRIRLMAASIGRGMIPVAAAKALNDRTGSYRAWSIDAKGDLNKALKDEVEGALNIPNFKDFKEASLTRPLREWYLRQLDLLNLLPPKR